MQTHKKRPESTSIVRFKHFVKVVFLRSLKALEENL